MGEVVIQVRRNGPYRVTGEVRLVDLEGNEIPIDTGEGSIFLCRCGQSRGKPFCDGTHKRCGWADGTET
ncbi:MAG: CDGSH iron-sulfur domain-containing protein [Chthonomonadales bacterium]|nr:CDGSH iron-sulfur domain-containing protein [Chthonomonadales bacterium]